MSAMQAREINMIQSFGVIDGTSLLNDDNFKVLTPPSATIVSCGSTPSSRKAARSPMPECGERSPIHSIVNRWSTRARRLWVDRQRSPGSPYVAVLRR